MEDVRGHLTHDPFKSGLLENACSARGAKTLCSELEACQTCTNTKLLIPVHICSFDTNQRSQESKKELAGWTSERHSAMR